MSNNKKTTKSGYSLIELLVVMGIIFLLAGVTLINHNRFGREIDLENTAYNVALTIRQAQAFGINRRDSLSTGFEEPKPYGVYFKTNVLSPVPGISDESFMVFIDDEGGAFGTDNLFSKNSGSSSSCIANSSDECISIVTLTKGVYISELCAGDNEATCTEVDELHITFKRPNPDAIIKSSSVASYAYAEITITSPIAGIAAQRISVGTAGQISIK